MNGKGLFQMKHMKGVVITGQNTLAISDQCPLPEEPCATGAFIKPLIWSPCTSDAHLCATGCASLPYLLARRWATRCAARS